MSRRTITIDFDTATEEVWLTAYQTIRDEGVELGPRIMVNDQRDEWEKGPRKDAED